MKSINTPLLLLTLFIAITANVSALTVEYRRMEPKPGDCYGKRWNDDWMPGSPECPCHFSGCNCKVTITNPVKSGINPRFMPGAGWLATVPIEGCEFEKMDGIGFAQMNNLSGSIFGVNEYSLRIVSWPEHPEYEGVELCLDGVIVSAENTITILIPQ